MSTLAIIVIIILAVIAAVALIGLGWTVVLQRRSRRLQQRFGSEYERTVSERGDQRRAESELIDRQRRRRDLDIHELDPAARARYIRNWEAVQARFVDDPVRAVAGADALITDVMEERGYPMADFEQKASDLSVDYPDVVQNYRSAHRVATASREGRAGTEDYRLAMVHYRSLFGELVDDGSERADEGDPGWRAGRREVS